MSTSTSRKRKKSRRVSEEEEGETSKILREVAEAGITKPAIRPTIEPEIREKLGTLISELIFDASDVAFELALLNCNERSNCPLVTKTIRLVKKVRELFTIQRKMTTARERAPEYT